MTRKEAEIIARILAEAVFYHDISITRDDMDILSKNEYFRDEFKDVTEQLRAEDAAYAKYDELMTEKFGADWPVRKIEAAAKKQIFEQAFDRQA